MLKIRKEPVRGCSATVCKARISSQFTKEKYGPSQDRIVKALLLGLLRYGPRCGCNLRATILHCRQGHRCRGEFNRPKWPYTFLTECKYPLDIDDALISVGGIFGTPRTSPTAPLTSVSCAIHLYKMRQMWSRIHETMFSTRSCQPIDFRFADSMRRELESWYAATPEQSYTAPGGQLSVFSSKEWFSIAYHHTILLIYRRHLIVSSCGSAAQNSGDRSARSQQAIDSAFTICSNAGRQICLLYRQLYISRSVNYTWGSLHMLFLGGLTYLHTLWASNDVRQATRRDDVYTTCTACTMVLVIMAERWKAAASYRDIFETLTSKTITMMCDTERASWPVAQSNTRKQPWVADQPATEQSLKQLPFQEWVDNVADIGMCEGVQSMLDTFLGERDIYGFES